MSTLEARIAEVLEAHAAKRPWSDAGVMRCSCGERFVAEFVHQLNALHRAHVAAMLAPVIREAQAEAWAAGRSACDREWSEITSGVSAHDMGSAHETPKPYRATS